MRYRGGPATLVKGTPEFDAAVRAEKVKADKFFAENPGKLNAVERPLVGSAA
jgi:hypothetical protein